MLKYCTLWAGFTQLVDRTVAERGALRPLMTRNFRGYSRSTIKECLLRRRVIYFNVPL